MIIIQPIGGLCNRMRAINSARVLAKKRGETLKVIWNVNPELGCPFEELFQKTDDFSLRNIHSKWDPQKVFSPAMITVPFSRQPRLRTE